MKYFLCRDLFSDDWCVVDQSALPLASFSTLEDAKSYLESLIVKSKS